MNFFINQHSTLPYVKMDVINDGRYNMSDIYTALQTATVKFSMENIDNGVKKIANATAFVVPKNNCDTCTEEYSIEYRWNERDTKEKGVFRGYFTISFDGNLVNENINIPIGKLIVPIAEPLYIHIK